MWELLFLSALFAHGDHHGLGLLDIQLVSERRVSMVAVWPDGTMSPDKAAWSESLKLYRQQKLCTLRQLKTVVPNGRVALLYECPEAGKISVQRIGEKLPIHQRPLALTLRQGGESTTQMWEATQRKFSQYAQSGRELSFHLCRTWLYDLLRAPEFWAWLALLALGGLSPRSFFLVLPLSTSALIFGLYDGAYRAEHPVLMWVLPAFGIVLTLLSANLAGRSKLSPSVFSAILVGVMLFLGLETGHRLASTEVSPLEHPAVAWAALGSALLWALPLSSLSYILGRKIAFTHRSRHVALLCLAALGVGLSAYRSYQSYQSFSSELKPDEIRLETASLFLTQGDQNLGTF